MTADAVLCVRNQPYSSEPYIQTEGAILEDRSYLDAELFAADGAFPDLAGTEKGYPVVNLSPSLRYSADTERHRASGGRRQTHGRRPGRRSSGWLESSLSVVR